MPTSIFAANHNKIWKNRWKCTLVATNLTGGFPLDETTIEGWIKSKIADNDDLLRAAIAQSMLDSEETKKFTSPEEAAKALAKDKSLKGFKRDDQGLYIEGRQVKAALKEAASVAAQGGSIEGGQKYGMLTTKKGLMAFFAEHVQVPDIRIHLHRDLPDEIRFDFVHLSGPSGPKNGFKQSEVVWEAEVSFTVESDYDFPKGWWEAVWTTGEQQGLGSDRSQGQGRYVVTQWNKSR